MGKTEIRTNQWKWLISLYINVRNNLQLGGSIEQVNILFGFGHQHIPEQLLKYLNLTSPWFVKQGTSAKLVFCIYVFNYNYYELVAPFVFLFFKHVIFIQGAIAGAFASVAINSWIYAGQVVLGSHTQSLPTPTLGCNLNSTLNDTINMSTLTYSQMTTSVYNTTESIPIPGK